MGGCCFHKLPTFQMDKMVQIRLLLVDKVVTLTAMFLVSSENDGWCRG